MCPHPLMTEEGLPQSEPLRSLTPIDKAGLFALVDKGKADASAVRTVTCRTVLEGRFRHLNYIRTLPAHVIDEPLPARGRHRAQPYGSTPGRAGLVSLRRHPRECRGPRHHAVQSRTRTRKGISTLRRYGGRRPHVKAARAHRRACQGPHRGRRQPRPCVTWSPMPTPGRQSRTPCAIPYPYPSPSTRSHKHAAQDPSERQPAVQACLNGP